MSDYQEKLAQAANEVTQESWVKSPDDDSTMVNWLPLITAIDQSEWPQIGLSCDGDWVVVSHHGLRKFPDGTYPPTWLLALDYRLQELRVSVNDRGIDAGMHSLAADLLPYESILLQGLKVGNDPAVNLVLGRRPDIGCSKR